MGGKFIGTGICCLGLGGAAIGSGILFGSFIYSTARHSFLKDELFSLTIICFALIESLALFSLLLSFLILFS